MTRMTAAIEAWPLRAPFRIANHVWSEARLLVVHLDDDGLQGRGEAAGVHYLGETPEDLLRIVEKLRPAIEAGISRDELQALMPPGGARNALDCALWDLEAKRTGRPVWELAEVGEPGPLLTTFTCGVAPAKDMAKAARHYAGARAIKIKLLGDAEDADRVLQIRAMRPEVWLGVDGNQAYDRARLDELLPVLIEAGVALIEQPLPIGRDADLTGLDCPIPLAADESAQTADDLAGLVGRYQVANIKLDKCGGLTAGLAMARRAQALGLEPMIGNMIGTSLSMAPAFIVGQLCTLVDLDGPIFLDADRAPPILYRQGKAICSFDVWGSV